MRKWTRWFALATAAAFYCGHADVQAQPERPVVVIPGILGSKLCVRGTNDVVWGNRWSLANFGDLALPAQYNADALPHAPCGLIETVNVLGPWQVDQYDDLIKTLSTLGYRRDGTLFVFDYDWRLSNRESARRLEAFIRQKIPSGKLDIVAHSMGGIVAKLWMVERNGAERVGALVTFGTPHLGSASTFKTLDQGWGFWANLAARGLGTVRETAMTFPSLYELLPAYKNCCGFKVATSKQPAYFDPFNPQEWSRFGWLPASFRSPERQAWLQRTLTNARAIAQTAVPPGPKFVPVVNTLIPTSWRVVFDPGDGRALHYLPQPGDGTVYQNSAANNQLLEARPALTTHQTIFADDASRQVLAFVLLQGPEPVKGVLPDIKANLRTQTGSLVGISNASAEIDPPVLAPGERGRFIVELAGHEDLATADVSNVRAFLGTAVLPSADREVDSRGPQNVLVRLIFPLEAPAELGAFSATVNLPSIADLSDTALVAPR